MYVMISSVSNPSVSFIYGITYTEGDVNNQTCTYVWSAVCVKTQNDAGIYNSCWYLRFMLVFTIHAGIYTSCWYRKYQYEV